MNSQVEIFGYSRKSPDDRKNTSVSIQNQNDLIGITCNSNNWNLNSIEEDRDISGGNRSRKGIRKQIEASKEFKKNNPDTKVYILVKDSKRFARDSTFFKDTIEDLRLSGVKVFSIMKNNFLDPTEISDRIISVVDEQAIFDAKKYSEIGEELKKSKNMPWTPAPFGYRYNKKKEFIVKKVEAKVIRGVLSDYVSKKDYKDIMKDYRLTKGKYYRIIENARKGVYSGFVCYNKKVKDGEGKIVQTEEVKYKGSHEPIISDELRERINERN